MQANASIPANSLVQYVYAIQEVYNDTNMPTTLVQNGSSDSGSGGGFISTITGAIGACVALQGLLLGIPYPEAEREVCFADSTQRVSPECCEVGQHPNIQSGSCRGSI